MSLQFYFGPSGSGKSTRLNHDLVKWSLAAPDKRFFLIVPDQFSLYTQMELVKSHPRRGIMNIEVLSFGRLAHRIFSEVGQSRATVLDDSGKSLILRKIAGDISDELPTIGKSLGKLGFVSEVKSLISELMQYAITPQEIQKMIKLFAGKHGALSAKLSEIQLLYEAFLKYKEDKYITNEETLDILCESLAKSVLIRGSVVVFDGFTGFTPLQNRVIQEMMRQAERVIVSVLLGKEAVPTEEAQKEQSLFYLTAHMVSDLSRLAKEAGVERGEDVYMEAAHRWGDSPALAHLEKHLFRYPLQPYAAEASNIVITESPSLLAEAREACLKIKELTSEQGLAFREIAIITGDMKNYAPYLEREAMKYAIPLYLDQTRGILLNPFTEFIRAALAVVINNYDYNGIFHFLRSGFVEIAVDEIDRLENYVIGCGIRGKKQWQEPFTRRQPSWRDEAEIKKQLLFLNQVREKVMAATYHLPVSSNPAPLAGTAGIHRPPTASPPTVAEIIESLYAFILSSRIQQKLAAYETAFAASGDLVKAKEYAQIFRLVMELLEQIHTLLGTEVLSLKEFAEILDAGFAEIRVGTIPQNIDRVVVGDMERTRLTQVRALFFLGVNDGNIPSGGKGGGLISDLDREFLREADWELAPTPRQRMYIQRLYLYMNMTKPAERLYLSYARVDGEGKALRPSYLIETMRKLFPSMTTLASAPQRELEQVYGLADSWDVFSERLRRYAAGEAGNINNGRYAMSEAPSGSDDNNLTDLVTLTVLGNIYRQNPAEHQTMESLIKQAFHRYSHRRLTKTVAELLYGELLTNSVSRLEKYAMCAYAHFLQYGLALRERDEYRFEAVDLGNVYHNVLEIFAVKLAEKNITWLEFTAADGESLLREAIASYTERCGETALFGSARDRQMMARIFRILSRTVSTLQWQLAQGDFRPERFEAAFGQGQGTLALRGRIDRIDVCETDSEVLVKVVDYKSGLKKFDLAALYYGLQLQLLVYLDAALAMTKETHPDKEALPAAALYYHVFDPVVRADEESGDDEIENSLLGEQRMTGVVSGGKGVIESLDRGFSAKSQIIPVSRKKDGGYTSSSDILAPADFALAVNYVNHTVTAMGKEIAAGEIAINPYEYQGRSGCDYCEFAPVCGFDPRLPGYQKRRLAERSAKETLELMHKELGI
jgi:ATP-dependent helicase/nuclease subunit B